MARIKIVTDSTADILPQQAQANAISVIPLNVHFGDETFKDWVDITPDKFYPKVSSSPVMPRTSQPSAGEFIEFYKQFAAEADVILGLHISGRLSGTLNSAETARGMVDFRVVNVDTRSATQGLAQLACLAARAARAGLDVDEIVAAVEKAREQSLVIFTVDTLEYLQKNGRIGRAQALLGSIMQVKPVLGLDAEGVIESIDKVRSRARVMPRLVEVMHERFPAGSRVDVSVIHAQAEGRAQELLALAREGYDVADAYIAPIGAVIGSHVGPGTIGLCVTPRLDF